MVTTLAFWLSDSGSIPAVHFFVIALSVSGFQTCSFGPCSLVSRMRKPRVISKQCTNHWVTPGLPSSISSLVSRPRLLAPRRCDSRAGSSEEPPLPQKAKQKSIHKLKKEIQKENRQCSSVFFSSSFLDVFHIQVVVFAAPAIL